MKTEEIERYKARLKEAIENGFSNDYLEMIINGIYELGKLDGMKDSKEIIER